MSALLERGEICFFYRPRVEQDEVEEPEDVQRFFVLLKPQRKVGP